MPSQRTARSPTSISAAARRSRRPGLAGATFLVESSFWGEMSPGVVSIRFNPAMRAANPACKSCLQVTPIQPLAPNLYRAATPILMRLMAQLYHHPLDPQSRFVRLALAEYGIEPDLIEERVFERRHDFLLLDPAGETPVLVTDHNVVVPSAPIIAEYLDENLGETLEEHRLLPLDFE